MENKNMENINKAETVKDIQKQAEDFTWTENQLGNIDINTDEILFTDVLSPKDFEQMTYETIQRCFKNDIYLPYMYRISPMMSVLKYCSNFNTSAFSDEDLFNICMYSKDLHKLFSSLMYINEEKYGNIAFIIDNLHNAIAYYREKLIHTTKVSQIAGELVDTLVSTISDDTLEDLKVLGEKFINEKANEVKE